MHEQYLNTIYQEMLRCQSAPDIDGLLFKYLHFYGSYDYVGASASWYSHEIRVVKNDPSIYSYRDAQGFRKGDNEKLRVHPIDAYVYHYGWVREPTAMQRKQENFNKHWHDDEWIEKNVLKADAFDYGRQIRELNRFTGEHPAVIKDRIADQNWQFDHDLSLNRRTLKDQTKDFFKRFGLDWSYKNYIINKKYC